MSTRHCPDRRVSHGHLYADTSVVHWTVVRERLTERPPRQVLGNGYEIYPECAEKLSGVASKRC